MLYYTTPIFWMFKLSCHGAAKESKIKYTESEGKCHYYLKTCLTIFILYILCVFGTLNDRERNDSVWKQSPWNWNMIRNEEMKYTAKVKGREADIHCKKWSVYINIQWNLLCETTQPAIIQNAIPRGLF